MNYDERAEHIAALIEERLGVRGDALDVKIRRAGRLLPKDIRRHANVLVEALSLQTNPKLARQIDAAGSKKSYEICEKYLSEIDANERRKGWILGFLTTNAFNFVVIVGVVIAVTVWRGLL